MNHYTSIILYPAHRLMRVTAQQGVPDAVPWPDTSIILYPVHRLMRVIAQQGCRGTQSPGRRARCPRFLSFFLACRRRRHRRGTWKVTEL